MLVTTFAIAFLLQAIALIIDLRDNTLGEVAASITSLNEPITVGGVDIRKITLVSVAVARVRATRPRAPAHANDDRPAHPRRRDRLPHGPAARACARTG